MKTFLEDTFMNSSANAPGTNMKFYYIFYAIGKEDCRRISPFHLAARVLQEQGKELHLLSPVLWPGMKAIIIISMWEPPAALRKRSFTTVWNMPKS